MTDLRLGWQAEDTTTARTAVANAALVRVNTRADISPAASGLINVETDEPAGTTTLDADGPAECEPGAARRWSEVEHQPKEKQ